MVLLHPERDADEAARPFTGAGCRRPGDLGLDHAIREVETLNHGQRIELAIARFRLLQRLL